MYFVCNPIFFVDVYEKKIKMCTCSHCMGLEYISKKQKRKNEIREKKRNDKFYSFEQIEIKYTNKNTFFSFEQIIIQKIVLYRVDRKSTRDLVENEITLFVISSEKVYRQDVEYYSHLLLVHMMVSMNSLM